VIYFVFEILLLLKVKSYENGHTLQNVKNCSFLGPKKLPRKLTKKIKEIDDEFSGSTWHKKGLLISKRNQN
jgi:hypothetical protein